MNVSKSDAEVSASFDVKAVADGEVFAGGSEQSEEVSVSIYDAQMNKINGKIDRGETFYVRANAPQTANFSVYCAVLDGKDIIKVFRGASNGGDALRLQMAEPNEWHTLQQRIVFSVPAKMHTAKLYVETTGDGANEDFYIDNCSLKKVITHEQYLRDNVSPDWSDGGLEDCLAVINEYKASLVSVCPKSSEKVLLNPYKGLNYYTTKFDLNNLDFTKQ